MDQKARTTRRNGEDLGDDDEDDDGDEEDEDEEVEISVCGG